MCLKEIGVEVNNCCGGFDYWSPLINTIMFKGPAVFSVLFNRWIYHALNARGVVHKCTGLSVHQSFLCVCVSVTLRIFCISLGFYTDHQWVITGQVAFILKKEKRFLSSINRVWIYKNAEIPIAGSMHPESH